MGRPASKAYGAFSLALLENFAPEAEKCLGIYRIVITIRGCFVEVYWKIRIRDHEYYANDKSVS